MPRRRTIPGSPVATPPRGALARRERILSVTLELIGERGVEAITMRDLALRCGVAVATLYNQFGSRESVIAEALRGDIMGRYQPVVNFGGKSDFFEAKKTQKQQLDEILD